jgi:hypothetical protein
MKGLGEQKNKKVRQGGAFCGYEEISDITLFVGRYCCCGWLKKMTGMAAPRAASTCGMRTSQRTY